MEQDKSLTVEDILLELDSRKTMLQQNHSLYAGYEQIADARIKDLNNIIQWIELNMRPSDNQANP